MSGSRLTILKGIFASCTIAGATIAANAQETPDPWQGSRIPGDEFVLPLPEMDDGTIQRLPGAFEAGLVLIDNGLPNVMITGYWPPTNEMIRHFSANPAQNPGGWVGENWENRGYNIYAFFPEFPNGGPNYGRGQGDFEVDYQDTSGDWWSITSMVRPLGIITFSRAGADNGWEMEGGNRTYAANLWTADYLTPLRPTPELPSYNEPNNFERFSTQPMQAIVDAVALSGANVTPFIEPIDNGRFLSNYIGYHGNWYRDLHASPADPDWCLVGGHVHVGYVMGMPDAILATEVTIRTVLTHMDYLLATLGDANCDGIITPSDIAPFVVALTTPDQYPVQYPECNAARADMNRDGLVTPADIAGFVARLTAP